MLFRNGLSRHGFDFGSRSRLADTFSAAASADFIFFRLAWNGDRPPGNRDRPVLNQDRLAWNLDRPTCNRDLVLKVWPFICLGRINTMKYWYIKAKPTQFDVTNSEKFCRPAGIRDRPAWNRDRPVWNRDCLAEKRDFVIVWKSVSISGRVYLISGRTFSAGQ